MTSTDRRRGEHRRSWVKESAGRPQPRQVADLTQIVTVRNEFFEAEAVWVRRSNVWACVDCDPELAWMMGMERLAARNELLKRGCRWTWNNRQKKSRPTQAKV